MTTFAMPQPSYRRGTNRLVRFKTRGWASSGFKREDVAAAHKVALQACSLCLLVGRQGSCVDSRVKAAFSADLRAQPMHGAPAVTRQSVSYREHQATALTHTPLTLCALSYTSQAEKLLIFVCRRCSRLLHSPPPTPPRHERMRIPAGHAHVHTHA